METGRPQRLATKRGNAEHQAAVVDFSYPPPGASIPRKGRTNFWPASSLASISLRVQPSGRHSHLITRPRRVGCDELVSVVSRLVAYADRAWQTVLGRSPAVCRGGLSRLESRAFVHGIDLSKLVPAGTRCERRRPSPAVCSDRSVRVHGFTDQRGTGGCDQAVSPVVRE